MNLFLIAAASLLIATTSKAASVSDDAVVRAVYLESVPPGECVQVRRSGCHLAITAALIAWKQLVRNVPSAGNSLAIFNTGDILRPLRIYGLSTAGAEYTCVRSAINRLLAKVYLQEDIYNALVRFNQSEPPLELNAQANPGVVSNARFKQFWTEYKRERPAFPGSFLCGAYNFYKKVIEPKVGQPIESLIAGITENPSRKPPAMVVVPHSRSAIAIIEEMRQSGTVKVRRLVQAILPPMPPPPLHVTKDGVPVVGKRRGKACDGSRKSKKAAPNTEVDDILEDEPGVVGDMNKPLFSTETYVDIDDMLDLPVQSIRFNHDRDDLSGPVDDVTNADAEFIEFYDSLLRA